MVAYIYVQGASRERRDSPLENPVLAQGTAWPASECIYACGTKEYYLNTYMCAQHLAACRSSHTPRSTYRCILYYAHTTHNSPRVLLKLHISHVQVLSAAPLAPKCQLRSSAPHVKMSVFILGAYPPPWVRPLDQHQIFTMSLQINATVITNYYKICREDEIEKRHFYF